jgi:2-oxoglutarate/2-oxoacid ferredoxin oxidoreductase subunit alpha
MALTANTTTLSMTGNDIVARAAIDAGCRFFAGYPISPSSEIAGAMAEMLPALGGAFIQMEDEIASMAAIIGAALTGAKTMTATSGPGFSLKQENLGYACMTETPCVIVNVMRSGPSTGMPTLPAQGEFMQARWGTHGDHPIIVLTPTFHDELYSETVRAFNLSEKYRTPVILLTDEVVAHMSGRVNIPDELHIENRPQPTVAPADYKYYDDAYPISPMVPFFKGYRFHVTGLTHDPNGFATESPVVAQKALERLVHKFDDHLDDICKWDEYQLDDADVVIVSVGSAARAAKQAVMQARSEGQKLGLFRPLTLWPFPEVALKRVAKNAKQVIVAEMNAGQMVLEVERILHRDITLASRYNGEMMTAEDILNTVQTLSAIG